MIKKIVILAGIFIMYSCNKDQVLNTRPVSSLKLVNLVSGGSPLLMSDIKTPIVNVDASENFNLKIGKPDIYIWPLGDSLNPVYVSNKSVDVESGDIFTLFVGGTPIDLATLFIKEKLPIHNDSTAGIRFVHLSHGGPVVNVVLSSSPDAVEFSNVSYKGVSEFKIYKATKAFSNYRFIIRDALTNDSLTSIMMSSSGSLNSFIPLFRNTTIVFKGIVGGLPSANVVRVNHY